VAHSFNFVVVESTVLFLSVPLSWLSFFVLVLFLFPFMFFLLLRDVLSPLISIVIGKEEVIEGHDIFEGGAGGAVIGAKDKGGGVREAGKEKDEGMGSGKGIGKVKSEREGIGEGGLKECLVGEGEEQDNGEGEQEREREGEGIDDAKGACDVTI